MTDAPIAGPDLRDVDHDWALFAVRLRTARKAAKLSQAAVGIRVEICTSYISQVEQRVSNPSLLTILRLAEAIGIPASKFFSDGR